MDPPIRFPDEVTYRWRSRCTTRSRKVAEFDEEIARLKKPVQLPSLIPFRSRQSIILQHSKPLLEFTLFGNLPIELRLRIFRMMMPGPRVIMLLNSPKFRHVYSRMRPPICLHICRESREESLRRFKLLVDPSLTTPSNAFRPRLYFDPSLDMIYLNCRLFPVFGRDPTGGRFCYLSRALGDLFNSLITPIKRLAFNFYDIKDALSQKALLRKVFLEFGDLEVLTMALCFTSPPHSVRLLGIEDEHNNVDKCLLRVLRSRSFVRFQRGVVKYGSRKLQKLGAAYPEWKVPVLEVKVMLNDYSL